MTVRLEREGRAVELVRDADLAVLNGLDHETERRCRNIEAGAGVPVAAEEVGYRLTSGRDAEPLSAYDPGGFYPLKALRRLKRAGLVRSVKQGQRGTLWFVTADGDALLEDRADDLPGPICWSCWSAEAMPALELDIEPPDDDIEPPDDGYIDGTCASCAITILEAAETEAREARRRAAERYDAVCRYTAAAFEAIDALPDD